MKDLIEMNKIIFYYYKLDLGNYLSTKTRVLLKKSDI